MVTERLIRKTLRRVARQWVSLVLQPGNVWLVEQAVSEDEGDDVVAALRTCAMRGWIVVEEQAVPHAEVGPRGELPATWSHVAPSYRLTESGWNAIHGYYKWVIAACIIAGASLFASLTSLVMLVATQR